MIRMGRKQSRQVVPWCIWVALVCCFILDGALAEAAISGVGDVAFVDENGRWSLPEPQPRLWLAIAAFVLAQGLLVFALIRLREPKHAQGSVFSADTPGP